MKARVGCPTTSGNSELKPTSSSVSAAAAAASMWPWFNNNPLMQSRVSLEAAESKKVISETASSTPHSRFFLNFVFLSALFVT